MIDHLLKNAYPKMDEDILSYYKLLAVELLRGYMEETLNIKISDTEGWDYDFEQKYVGPIFIMTTNAIDYEKTKGLKSIKQGNKQISWNTYDNKQFVFTQEVKDMLPYPNVSFLG